MSYIQNDTNFDETGFPLFADIKKRFGFVPNLLRAQTLRPDLLEAQSKLGYALITKEGALTRTQKEYIFLVCSAANLSTYCVTAHCEIVRMLGLRGPEPEQIAVDHIHANIPICDKALLNFTLKLSNQPTKITGDDVDTLRTYGFSEQQILEAVLVTAFAKFSNFAAFGLGTVPDFEPKLPLTQSR